MSTGLEHDQSITRLERQREDEDPPGRSLRIDVCGHVRVTVDGERRVHEIYHQGRMILAFLAIHRDRPISRDELELALWGDHSSCDRAAGLSTILSRLRRTLGADVIESRGRMSVQLADDVVVDLHEVPRLLADAQDALLRIDPTAAAAAAEQALRIAEGGLLHGETVPWLDDPRRDLVEQALRARECIAEAALLQAGPELGTATDQAREIIKVEPYRESGHALLMRSLEAQGNAAQALAVYEELREQLNEELGIAPGPHLRALHSRLLGAPRGHVPETAPATATRRAPVLPLASSRVRAQFVGRETELSTLRQLFHGPTDGSCRLTLLEGEPGIGKTRLAMQFAQECQQRGAIILYGRCDPESVVPYQPFVEALRGALGPDVLEAMRMRIPAHLSELGRVLPEIADAASLALPAPGADAGAERYRLFDSVSTVLAEVSSMHPMLLILDDLHWADKATLLMLRQVIRSAREAPMLVLGTYRDTERGQALLDTLADLHREHVVQRISLAGLDEGPTTELIDHVSDHSVPAHLRRRLWEECRGNPFFLEEMLRHQISARGSQRSEPLPHAVTDVIGRRLARVSADLRTILEIACVAGNQFSIDVVESLSELDEDALDRALSEAIVAHLVEEVPGVYGRLAFQHALIRQTLYEQLTRTRRGRLHLRVGELLEGRDAGDAPGLAELAHHFSHAPPEAGREKAAKYAALAARHALEVLAYEEAVRHYGTALTVLGPTAGAERRHQLLLGLGEAQVRAGDIPSARASFRQAGDAAREMGSATGFARAALGCAVFAPIVDQEMVRLLEEALAWLGDGEPVLRSRLMSRLVMELSLSRDLARVETLSEDALTIARQTGDSGALCSALTVRRFAMWGPENIIERQRLASELLHVAAGSGSGCGSGRLAMEAHRWWLMDLLEFGDIDGAAAAIAAYETLAEERRLPCELWWISMFRAMRLLLSGRFDEAARHSRAGFELADRVGDPAAGGVFTLQAVTIERDRGGLAKLEDDIRGMIASQPAIPGWRAVLTHLLCETGRREEARAELDALSANRFDRLPRDAIWLGAIAYCAETAAALAATEHAAVLYDLLRRFPDRNIVVGWVSACLGSSSRPLALLAATIGNRRDAIRHFEDALAMNERIGAAAWLARTRVEYATFLLGQPDLRDDPRARALLDVGLAAARELGMPSLVGYDTRTAREVRPADSGSA